jgi:hypothetical protein
LISPLAPLFLRYFRHFHSITPFRRRHDAIIYSAAADAIITLIIDALMPRWLLPLR